MRLFRGVSLDDVRVTCRVLTWVSHDSTQIPQLSTNLKAAKQQPLDVCLQSVGIQSTLHQPSLILWLMNKTLY